MNPQDWTGYLVAAAAAVTALGVLWRAARRIGRRLDAMNRLLDRELTHNHGSSMKDDVHGMAVALGETQRSVDDLRDEVDQVKRKVASLENPKNRRRTW